MSLAPDVPPEPGGEVYTLPSGRVRLVGCDTLCQWRALVERPEGETIVPLGSAWPAAYRRTAVLDDQLGPP